MAPRLTAPAALPDDPVQFPVATWRLTASLTTIPHMCCTDLHTGKTPTHIRQKVRKRVGLIRFSVFVFQDRVSLCSSDCPGTHSVDQAGFKLTETYLPLPSEC